MSGSLRYSVNNYWDSSTNQIAPAVFFWTLLHYVNDHSTLVFRGYGTGKSSSGVTPPAAWLDWDPSTTPTPPMGDNSWFVFEANKASNELDSSGNDPWQAKLQFTTSSGFDDCNVADTDYENEADTHICCMRVSPCAGWDNDTDLDFEPVGGEDISDNHILFDDTNDGKFVLDIIGDDDTIWWVGACFDGDLAAESGSRAKGGHVGLFTRRSSNIDYPFLFMSMPIHDSAVYMFHCNETWNFPGSPPSIIIPWYTFSLWNDGTKITRHRIDAWDTTSRSYLTKDYLTGDEVVLGCLLCAEDDTESRYGILGEFRLIGSTGKSYAQGALVGSNLDWKQICYQATSYSGILLKWPAGVAPIWP